MKNKKEALLAILLGIVLPVLLLSCQKGKKQLRAENSTLSVLTEDGVMQMDVEVYLTGVLLCEMPADFEEEALKAQAIAARTFALYRKENGSKHVNADICASANCCQGYINPNKYISSGGTAAAVLKMYEAVNGTRGEVIFYEGELIEATYFASSGGRTEDAQAVWGADVPYLVSVDSVEADTLYTGEVDKETFCTALGLSKGEVYIDMPIYTQGGGVAEVCINGKVFTGLQLRQCLGLRSTQISFYVGKESVQIVTNGHGHRVGLSQYGADAMAVGGSDYRQILTHYYSGTTIQSYAPNKN